MATITGLKLSELENLVLGSTGTLFYAAAAGSNSFKMSEINVYNTLYKLHLSGNFQPKNEDWRFMKVTGEQVITGTKRFVNGVAADGIVSYTSDNTNTPLINVLNGTLFPRILAGISVDWSGRILSGNWTSQQIQLMKPIISGLAPSTPTSAGVSGQLAISGQKLFIATGTNQWGYVNITPWI